MARPRTKTKAPALAKKAPSCASRVQSSPVATAHVDGPCGLNAMSAGAALLPNQRFGGARTSHTNRPAPKKSQTLSDCVQTGDARGYQVDRPQQLVLANILGRELVG